MTRSAVTWWVRLEWKPEDCWVGAYWRRSNLGSPPTRVLDVWVCILPMIPIHLQVTRWPTIKM